MSNPTIGAFAPVKYTHSDIEDECVLFIVGETPDEIEEHDRIIFERLGDSGDIENITVIEVTPQEWWDIKHGTNISKGFYVNDTNQIELIKKDK